jgi:integrase
LLLDKRHRFKLGAVCATRQASERERTIVVCGRDHKCAPPAPPHRLGTDSASKGKRGGRSIPLNDELRAALLALHAAGKPRPDAGAHAHVALAVDDPLIVQVWFHRLYAELGFEGASSHSGRRTFITKAARKIVEAGGSLRDVQELAGHASLSTTQRYIEGSTDAKRRVVNM